MRKANKVLLALLIIGLAGLTATIGIVVGTGMLTSRETAKTYTVDEAFDDVAFDTVQAQVDIRQSGGACTVEAYAKAWLTEPIDMDALVSADVHGDTLVVTETPFTPVFLGIFPQPYELTLTVYLPPEAYEKVTEGMR